MELDNFSRGGGRHGGVFSGSRDYLDGEDEDEDLEVRASLYDLWGSDVVPAVKDATGSS